MVLLLKRSAEGRHSVTFSVQENSAVARKVVKCPRRTKIARGRLVVHSGQQPGAGATAYTQSFAACGTMDQRARKFADVFVPHYRYETRTQRDAQVLTHAAGHLDCTELEVPLSYRSHGSIPSVSLRPCWSVPLKPPPYPPVAPSTERCSGRSGVAARHVCRARRSVRHPAR